MHAIKQDLTYALRLLVKQPGVTCIAILTLALGIGANTAIFSAVNAILLRPLPYADPDRLVMVFEKRLAEGVLDNVVSPADFLDWSKMNGAFDGIAAMTDANADLTGAGEPVRLSAGAVSPPFFDVLGVQPALGRTFRTEEAIVGQHRVVILSHGLWQRRFGSDAVDRRPQDPAERDSSRSGRRPAVHLRVPEHRADAVERRSRSKADTQAPSRVNHFLSVYARLKPGVTLERARAEMDRVGAQLQKEYPEANRNHGAHVSPLRDQLQAPVRDGLLALLGAVAFVLLIACVNVANLLLAKAASRKREMAVRAALGAGRMRLAGQTLTESVLLALCGGAGGVLVAKWGIELLRQLAPQGVPVLGVDHVGLDPRVLAFTFFLSIGTGLLFGLLPAWHLASQDVNESLKDGGRTLGVRRRLRVALVVSEIALASLLLVGAGLTLRSFQTLLQAEAGFRQQGVLTAFITLPAGRYREDGKRVATYDEIERRMASLPGVRSVGATSHLPLSGQDRARVSASRTRAHAGHADAGAPARRHDRLLQDDGDQARVRAQLRRDRSQRVAVRRHRQRDDGAALLAGRLPARQARARFGGVRRSPGARSSAS